MVWDTKERGARRMIAGWYTEKADEAGRTMMDWRKRKVREAAYTMRILADCPSEDMVRKRVIGGIWIDGLLNSAIDLTYIWPQTWIEACDCRPWG